MSALFGGIQRTAFLCSLLALSIPAAYAIEENDEIELSDGDVTRLPPDPIPNPGAPNPPQGGGRSSYRSHAAWVAQGLEAAKSRIKDSPLKFASTAGTIGTVALACKEPNKEQSCFGPTLTCRDMKIEMLQYFAKDIENRSKRFQERGLPLEIDDGQGLDVASTNGKIPIVPWYQDIPGYSQKQLGSQSRLSPAGSDTQAVYRHFERLSGGIARIIGGRSDDGALAPFTGGGKQPGVVVRVTEGYGKMEQALIAGAKQIALDYASAQIMNEVINGELKLSRVCSHHIGLLQANNNQYDSLARAIPPQYCNSERHDTQVKLLKTAIQEQMSKAAPSKVLMCEALVRYWQYHQKMFSSPEAFKKFRDGLAARIAESPLLQVACKGKLNRRKAGECLAKCMRGDGCSPVYAPSFLSEYQHRLSEVVGPSFWSPATSIESLLSENWSTGGVRPDPLIDPGSAK